MNDLLEKLCNLVCFEAGAADCYFENYIKEQIEIYELKLISRYYCYNNKEQVVTAISLENSRHGINLDANYLALRWDKFYSNKQNKRFDDNIKTQIIARDKYCSYCNRYNSLEVHHVIPQAKHGSHSFYNLVSTCESCNKAIGANIVLPKNWTALHPESVFWSCGKQKPNGDNY